jgi:hypothetical protein
VQLEIIADWVITWVCVIFNPFAFLQRHTAVVCPLRSVGSSTQLLLVLRSDLARGLDEPDRLSYSELPKSADEMHLLHSLSCIS